MTQPMRGRTLITDEGVVGGASVRGLALVVLRLARSHPQLVPPALR